MGVFVSRAPAIRKERVTGWLSFFLVVSFLSVGSVAREILPWFCMEWLGRGPLPNRNHSVTNEIFLTDVGQGVPVTHSVS